MEASRKKALVLSYSPVARDPRVRRQIQWLESAGFEVEVWGLGSSPNVGEAKYSEITFPPFLARIFAYLFLSSKSRSSMFVGRQLARITTDGIGSSRHQLVILNDLDFLGLDNHFNHWESQGTKVAIDLHEYFYDVGGSPLWRLFHVRYYRWLLKKLELRSIARIFTVSEEIAKLYEAKIKRPLVSLENTPDSSRVSQLVRKSAPVDDGKSIQLVHHGIFGKGRGVLRLIAAMRYVNKRFSLNLMLLMSPISRLLVVGISHFYRVSGRVKILKPTPMVEILDTLSRFDLEVIFYHPPHSTNELYSLPNKFFESISAGLGLVVGSSPSMSAIVKKYELGAVADSWTAKSLGAAINGLTTNKINRAKMQGALALEDYSDTKIQQKFLRSLEPGKSQYDD